MDSMNVRWVRKVLEYIGGASDEAPFGLPIPLSSPLWGLWWGILLVVIYIFCGQSSKFIYIDF